MRINVRDHSLDLKRDKLLNGSVQAYCSVLIHKYIIKDVQLKGKTVIEGHCKREKRKVKYYFIFYFIFRFFIHYTPSILC